MIVNGCKAYDSELKNIDIGNRVRRKARVEVVEQDGQKCVDCGRLFRSIRGLKIHTRSCKEIRRREVVLDISEFKCACGKQCSNRSGFTRHKKFCNA